MIKRIFSSELSKGTIILFITINIFNFLNFLFQFIMGRMLGPINYSTLAVLMSITYLYGVPTEAIQNIISRYTSKFNIKNEKRKIKYLLFKSLNRGFKFSIIVFILAGILSYFVAEYLDINFFLILLTNIFVFSAFLNPIMRGVLQGRKKFGHLGINLMISSGLKLIFAISLVIFGFGIFGAMTGVLMGAFSGIIFSLYFNKDVLEEKKEKVSFNKIYSESISYFIVMFAVLIMFSLDIILAKRFFSDELAGQYSALSYIGKMIFFGTVAIGKAMFPITSERHDKKKDSSRIFRKSLGIILILSLVTIMIYSIFPELIIRILYGEKYVVMAPYLIYSAIAITFLALSNITLTYGLSIKSIKKPMFLFLFVIIEIILFYLFHKNIFEYIMASMVSNIIMFIGSLFFLKR